MIRITYANYAIVHLACFALGFAISALWRTVRRPYDSRPVIAPRAELPPATARKIARARRRNRSDLRAVSIRRTRTEPPWLPPSFDDFDTEETHG